MQMQGIISELRMCVYGTDAAMRAKRLVCHPGKESTRREEKGEVTESRVASLLG